MGEVGMTDRQFDAYREELLNSLKYALKESPDNVELKKAVERLETQLRRP